MQKGGVEDLLRLLLCSEKPLTIKEISENFNVSEKTIWNRLHSKELLKYLKESIHLVKKTNVGIYLEGDEKEIQELKKRLIFSCGEDNQNDEFRRNRILMDILISPYSLTIQNLVDRYLVSRKVVQMDLDFLKHFLEMNNLRLQRVQNVGIQVVGDEIVIRQLLENTILRTTVFFKNDLHKDVVFDEGVKAVLDKINLSDYLVNSIEIVKMIQQKLVGTFTDEGRKEITLQILICLKRKQIGKYINEIYDERFESNSHIQQFIHIFDRNHIRLQKNDYLYLWRRCVNNRFAVSNKKTVDEKFIRLSKNLLSCVMDISEDKEIDYLIKNLAFHIEQAVKRSSIGVKVHNPILKRVKQKYGKFYSMVLTNVNMVEKEYHITLNEDEIGFITIYICTIYEKNINNNYFKVLLISDEGVGHTQFIAMQIMNHFPNLLIHGITNSLNVEETALQECDLIISTCPLFIKKEYFEKQVRISNFIDENDIESISQCLLKTAIQKQSNREKESNQNIDFNYFKCNLESKEEILKTYLDVAYQSKYCDSEYAATVLAREERASTSLGKGIAIPHGDDSHILKPSVFVVKNEKPILWGNEKVDTILFLILKFKSIHENRQFFIRLYSCMEKTELIRDIDGEEKLESLKKYILGG